MSNGLNCPGCGEWVNYIDVAYGNECPHCAFGGDNG